MKQRKFSKLIDTVASKNFSSVKDMLQEVLEQIVQNDEILVTGGRVWQFDVENKGYRLLFQMGNVQKIKTNFVLKLDENAIFETVSQERTILADETNEILIKKGIFKYSASGIGEKIKFGGKRYYQYLIAVNSQVVDDDLRDTLNIVATVLTSKLRERRLSSSQKKIFADIDKARQIQRSILPEHEYQFHKYDIFGVTVPAEIIGGDFFDYLKIGDDDERLAIAVGDAASKGFGAAAEAMYIAGAIRMASTFQIKISLLMFRMNELINKIFADDKFTSLFYGELSLDRKGLFLYANGGHNPPIFIRANNKRATYLESTGPLLGPAPHSKFETHSIDFRAGDVLVIFSDGIVEAANNNYDFYEEQRLEKVIRKSMHLSPKEIAYTILDDVTKFSTSESKYQDDRTLVVIKRKEDNVSA